MIQQDFNKRISIIIDKDLEEWKVLNTVGHISAYLGNKIGDNFLTGDTFQTKDGVHYPRNCQYPIIALSATKDQLKELMEKVRLSGLEYIAYIPEMIEHTDDEALMEKVSQKGDHELEYLGIGVFGENEKVKELTRQFSLWK